MYDSSKRESFIVNKQTLLKAYAIEKALSFSNVKSYVAHNLMNMLGKKEKAHSIQDTKGGPSTNYFIKYVENNQISNCL